MNISSIPTSVSSVPLSTSAISPSISAIPSTSSEIPPTSNEIPPTLNRISLSSTDIQTNSGEIFPTINAEPSTTISVDDNKDDNLNNMDEQCQGLSIQDSNLSPSTRSFSDISNLPEAIDLTHGKMGVIKIHLSTDTRSMNRSEKVSSVQLSTLPFEMSTYVVHYEAFFDGKPEPFDSSYGRKKPSDWRTADLLPGLMIACRNLNVHERAQFILSPEYFYGQAGCPPRIPPNSSALYLNEMLQIKPNDRLAEDATASDLKEQGNHLFKNNQWKDAIRAWKKSIEQIGVVCGNDIEALQMKEHLHCNVALACIRLADWEKAERHSKAALRLNRFNTKALYRLAVAYRCLENYDMARSTLLSLLKLEPQSSSARQELKTLSDAMFKCSAAESSLPVCPDEQYPVVGHARSQKPDSKLIAAICKRLDDFYNQTDNQVFTMDADRLTDCDIEYVQRKAEDKQMTTRLVCFDGIRILHVLKNKSV